MSVDAEAEAENKDVQVSLTENVELTFGSEARRRSGRTRTFRSASRTFRILVCCKCSIDYDFLIQNNSKSGPILARGIFLKNIHSDRTEGLVLVRLEDFAEFQWDFHFERQAKLPQKAKQV